MYRVLTTLAGVAVVACITRPAAAQGPWPADRGEPGDERVQRYLGHESLSIHARFQDDLRSAEQWAKDRPRYEQEYLYMLGLWPLPEKGDLRVTAVGSVQGDGFVVEKLHYQSIPGLYVTCNLYRPATTAPGEKLPAVLYVCGHWGMGRHGVKTGFQSHGMWYARHGYVCLIVDTLQLGEIAGVHHGTYREQRWWWHSRGYTPAGVECWNGIRGIDYLVSRPDVDPERIAVTGASGGGAASFWIAAADQRIKVAVPVSGMGDLPSYVADRVVNGHCDCMFMYNTFQWPWTRIPALIAPRPLLLVNSNQDTIFPMDANERTIALLERFYGMFGAGDLVDALVSIGAHEYRKDIRQAGYRFINTHLKNDPRPVTDSEVDLVTGEGDHRVFPIAPEKLRVFPQDADIPKDELNTKIDQYFVPVAKVEAPVAGAFEAWKRGLVSELRRVSFRCLPERVEPARLLDQESAGKTRMGSEPGIEFCLRTVRPLAASPARVLLIVTHLSGASDPSDAVKKLIQPDDAVYFCDTRGVDDTRWTRKNPPNYVERAYALLGRTVDAGRVWDVAAAARYLFALTHGKIPVQVAGEGGAGMVGACAALFEEDITGVTLIDPPASFMDPAAPQFLNVLRVCDAAEVLGMLAPRSLKIVRCQKETWRRMAAIYDAAGAGKNLVNVE